MASRPAPPPRRGALHLLLFAMTAASLTYAGGFWQGLGGEALTFADLVRPDYVWRSLAAGWPYGLWVLVILGTHEMGHYLACRHYRIPATLPFFIPGPPPIGSFGAVIRIRGPIPNRTALFDVAAAGPIAGFAVTLPVLALGLVRARHLPESDPIAEATGYLGAPIGMELLQRLLVDHSHLEVNGLIGAGWVGLLVTSLNLFPVGQLDGGHAAYALSRAVHRAASRLTLIGLAGLILVQAFYYGRFPAYVVWFAILLWMRDRHPRLLDESEPLSAARKLVALLLLVIFSLSFMVVPLHFAGS